MITDRCGDNWWVIFGARETSFSSQLKRSNGEWYHELVFAELDRLNEEMTKIYSDRFKLEVKSLEHAHLMEVEFAIVLRLYDVDDVTFQKLRYEGYEMTHI